MTPTTHNLTGAALGVVGLALLPTQEAWLFLGGCVFGARAPDWMEIAGYNKWADRRCSLVPHRTLTHWPWLWLLLLAASAVSILQNGASIKPAIALAGFFASGLLHVGMDYLTPAGVPMGANPFGKRTSGYVMKTGSVWEILVGIAAVGVIGAVWAIRMMTL